MLPSVTLGCSRRRVPHRQVAGKLAGRRRTGEVVDRIGARVGAEDGARELGGLLGDRRLIGSSPRLRGDLRGGRRVAEVGRVGALRTGGGGVCAVDSDVLSLGLEETWGFWSSRGEGAGAAVVGGGIHREREGGSVAKTGV